jgi:cytochrome c peroxidase
MWAAGRVALGQGYAPLQKVVLEPIPGIERYVRDQSALIVLGKALFWDMQVGSDDRTACGSCHFHAGADHRTAGMRLQDFPSRVFADPDDNRSAVRDSGRHTGSIGVGGQMTPRNAPTVINAVFEARVFHDGRASDIFNGRNPFGESDPAEHATAFVNGQRVPELVRLPRSSIASQAMAPPVNTVEMAYEGRTWEGVARKLLPARPLARQRVAPDDSVLWALAGVESYETLARAAFQPAYTDAAVVVDNFPLFFGLAAQAYIGTLVADDTPFDRFLSGRRDALSTRELSGFLVYQTRAFCQFCHSGAEMTTEGVTFTASHGKVDVVVSGTSELFADTGFFRTGVQAADEDEGLGGTDDFGAPFSVAARSGQGPLAVAGAFKVPGLRNVELTGPYFHNGGQATLEQVVQFYVRGGDFSNRAGMPVQIGRFPLEAADRADMVAFLKSLTDDRVRYERAPFDHPELCVRVGESWAGAPAVGRGGNAVPLQTFEELLKGVGEDGSRAHTLKDACEIR